MGRLDNKLIFDLINIFNEENSALNLSAPLKGFVEGLTLFTMNKTAHYIDYFFLSLLKHCYLKGKVHPKIRILSLSTQNLVFQICFFFFLSSVEHIRKYLEVFVYIESQ